MEFAEVKIKVIPEIAEWRVKMHEKGHCQKIQPLITIISCTDSRFPLSPLYTLQSSLSPANSYLSGS